MAAAARLQAQQDMAAVLERLDRLERQNRELIEEVRALRAEVSGRDAGPPAEATLDERLSVQERRVEEQAQAKVESGRKVPMRVTGVVLFNAFLNTSRFAGTADYPTAAALTPGPRTSGGSLRQST
ncbi:MAG TPA: hypothetical protein VHN20_13435, partial [Beijerinckiaceae bacterium]|nr:hypothetical protein [Beijerinckiaceae bacterium]